MMAQRVRLRAGADDEHVTRAQPALKAPVEENAVNEAAQAHRDGSEAHGDQHNAARNIVTANQIKRAGEQQP